MRRSRGIGSRPWTRLRLAALDRDGYTCGDCGKTAARFEVHHRDKNARNNSLDNLVCLCRGCHIRVHLPIGHVTPDWKGFGVD